MCWFFYSSAHHAQDHFRDRLCSTARTRNSDDIPWDAHKLLCEYESPVDFSASQWQRDKTKVSLWYLVFRVVLALVTLGSTIAYLALSSQDRLEKFLVFLTYQGMIFIVMFQVRKCAYV